MNNIIEFRVLRFIEIKKKMLVLLKKFTRNQNKKNEKKVQFCFDDFDKIHENVK